METYDQELIIMIMNQILENAERIDYYVRTHGLYNEQFVIDWQDKLNDISVRG